MVNTKKQRVLASVEDSRQFLMNDLNPSSSSYIKVQQKKRKFVSSIEKDVDEITRSFINSSPRNTSSGLRLRNRFCSEYRNWKRIMSWQKNESDVENRDPNYNRLVDGSGSDVEMEEKMPESKISSRGSSEEENSNVEDAFRNPKSGHQKSKKSRRCNSRVPSSSRYLRAKQRIPFHVRSNSSSFGGFHPSGSRRLDLRGGTTAIGIKLRTCAILATDGNETVDDVIWNNMVHKIHVIDARRTLASAGAGHTRAVNIAEGCLRRWLEKFYEQGRPSVADCAEVGCSIYNHAYHTERVDRKYTFQVLMAGWDLKDGDEVATPSICSFHEGGWFEVEEFYSCGSGKKYADARLTKYYDIDMSERNGIKLALECLVDGATYDIPQSGGYTNIWIIRNGQIVKKHRLRLEDWTERWEINQKEA